MRSAVAVAVLLLAIAATADRQKRQSEATLEESKLRQVIQDLCKNKTPNEYFRFPGDDGKYKCNFVVSCDGERVQGLKCPTGLNFDVKKQACDWETQVNCDLIEKPKLPKPKLNTDEPICQDPSQTACADETCLATIRFCDGTPDCNDGSDENACDLESDPNRAGPCDKAECALPECFCSEDGTETPNGLPAAEIPQMITISFNGAINNNNIEMYDELFDNLRVNPNGCPIKGTFFVSHKYTNYTAVQDLHARGHEIGVFSISQNDSTDYWNNLTSADWAAEMVGQRSIIEKFANIPQTTEGGVVGMRTPYLRVGGNAQFFMLSDQFFLYDATMTAPISERPLWPYTVQTQIPHRCYGSEQKCPSRSFPVWEMVINELDPRDDPGSSDVLPGCSTVDSCSNIRNGDILQKFLDSNFVRHYYTNRAPFSLSFNSAFLTKDEFLTSLTFWIDDILANFPDVYFVTQTQVIEYMQNPQTIDQINNFEYWLNKCKEPEPFPCAKIGGRHCTLSNSNVTGTYNMQTCLKCPSVYPWLLNPTGETR